MTSLHNNLVNLFETYVSESEKFEIKQVKSSGIRARKALSELTKFAKERRKEIQETKTADK